MSATEPLLQIEGVRKTYEDVEVLRGVDLAIAPHEVVCLIGASGCGKSTLLKCANLIEPVSDGRIVFAGNEITAPDVDIDRIRREIGIVFQAYNLFPHMSVLANVTLAPRKVLKLSEADASERARELLDRFGLADKAERVPRPPVGRPAAARRDRARAGDAAEADAARRDHERARPGAGRRGARRRARAGDSRA